MPFGTTLRLLRLDSGLSLRDLARRLSVSGTYLSRVENGLDSAPTPARLRAIARELQVPEPLLLGLAHQVSPLVFDYVRQEPEAAALFLEMADRRLGPAELLEVRKFIDARFPRPSGRELCAPMGLTDMLDLDRIVVGMTCSSLDDVFDVAAGRLAPALGAQGPALSSALKARDREVPCAIGGGLAVSCVHLEGSASKAALVTLAEGLSHDTPDRSPLRVVIVLAGPRSSAERRLCLLHLARWAARGLSADLARAASPKDVLACLATLDAEAGSPKAGSS